MSEVLFLRSETNLGSGFLKFPDLKSSLEKHLGLAQMLPDLEEFIRSVNDLVKDNRYSPEERNDLKRMRQRAYDRRRGLRDSEVRTVPIEPLAFKEASPDPIKIEEHTTMALQSVDVTTPQKVSVPLLQKPNFWEGVQTAFNKIDGEQFVRALPGTLSLLISTSLVALFLWLQSLELYKSSGFSQPQLAATGGLLMVVGFAAYYSICRTKLALFLCFYAGGYEMYFMTSGTVQDEKVAATSSTVNPEMGFLNEKADKMREAYALLKVRYDDPASGVYKNGWFKAKHLDPAWQKNEQAQQEYLGKRSMLEERGASSHITWLKILYRLGLVFLCMVFTHALVRKLKEG